jgi:FlaA1/EpsC-like NDP-sugar epimerase
MTRAEELVIVTDRLAGNKLKIALKACLKNNIVPRLVGHDLEVDMKQDEVKDFELAQLLNRTPIDVNMKPVEEMITGQVVMVTGGGGSIGSELCRQIIKMNPSKLIIVDHSELNLYGIDSELQGHKNIHSLLVDVKDNETLTEVFMAYRPQVIYHAAAYKHVHLVEKNPFPSIINNIHGTKNMIECALEFGVKAFVLISSDKAVNPSSIMGSTKRVCELMVTKAGQLSQVRFCSVRFGNVLGSSGSLVPLLQKQVKAGGPVTVTDPKMTRYFMLIPEAIKLVLKAGQISSPGDVNILRMGEPVKIIDLARKVITLMGKTEKEIPIVFIGKKPGEKLFEELYLSGKETPTEHSEIVMLPNGDSIYDSSRFMGQELEFVVDKLVRLAYAHDETALVLLKNLVFMHKPDDLVNFSTDTNLIEAV